MALKKLPSGELENFVLDILWDAERPLNPGEVHEALRAQRRLAYTTVMTIMVRLWEKGLLTRERAGRSFVYETLMTREERAASRMQELLAAARDPILALSCFVETLPQGQRDELRRALRGQKAPKT